MMLMMMSTMVKVCRAFAVALLLFCLSRAVAWLWLLSSRRCKPVNTQQLPSGSMGWPIIGESIQFVSSYRSNRPDSFLNYRTARYGHVFKTHLFGKPTIVSVDPELNRFILCNEGKLFSPDYPRTLNDLWGKWAILRLEGSLHRKVYGLIATFLKSCQLKETLARDVELYVKRSMSNWKDQLIYMEDEAKQVGFNATAKTLLSLTPGRETEMLRKEFHDYLAGIVSLPIRFPGSTFSRSLQAKENMVRLVKRIIRDRNERLGTSESKSDLLEVLMQEKDENGANFPLELITDNIVTFLFPAEDSVGMLITLAVKFLTECPKALNEMREENLRLKASKGAGQLTWKDYMDLQFTQKVLDETLRLGNIVKGVIRRSLVDIQFKGFMIPQGWAVFPFFRGVHLSKELYADPHVFNPWRWQGMKGGIMRFSPFGGGQRYCSGNEIAKLEATIFLHHLVTAFTWRKREEAEEETIVNFPFVRLAKRLPLIMEELRV